MKDHNKIYSAEEFEVGVTIISLPLIVDDVFRLARNCSKTLWKR